MVYCLPLWEGLQNTRRYVPQRYSTIHIHVHVPLLPLHVFNYLVGSNYSQEYERGVEWIISQ